MELNRLTAVSPVDGRYGAQTEPLAPYFSEYGLICYRVRVEIEYFIALCEYPLPQLEGVDAGLYESLRDIYRNFTEEDAQSIKNIEKTTNHDVKAVEYFIKEKFDALGLSDHKEFIHFGLTSQDVNNTSVPLSLKEAMEEQVLPLFEEVCVLMENKSKEWGNVSMLAKTHGQPASPTRLGKEIEVFTERLAIQKGQLLQVPFAAKFGGATGNFNAHNVAYPAIHWKSFGDQFVAEYLGLVRSHPTTQIEHYDNLAAYFDALKRINTILIDFSRDVWQYVSMNYFKQKIKEGEVGSSAMPHKVNPIDFENAEGNLGIASAIFEHLSAKLPISRLQRDLTDSTVLRNIGVPLGHLVIALNSLKKGLNKLELNEAAIRQDLEDNWAVVAEAIQTILRREAYPNPYEALKALTRTNEKITGESIATFIEGLDVSEEIKAELRVITPWNYTGI
ncbi:adenylosuccinate lyase [Persicobacter diffluens]|uniref:Adenylosuccinate lyase n=1 Tax=Persicobacter diffluens TaxID=981 RepID=A0AAN5AKQ6_9BACT|nr:adenylosuccinate lyase [Persicobacter diffluens]